MNIRFTSKAGISSESSGAMAGRAALLADGDSMLEMESDSGLTCLLSKDKDCQVRLKRPLAAKKGNLNEIVVHLSPSTTSSMSDDLILVKGEIKGEHIDKGIFSL